MVGRSWQQGSLAFIDEVAEYDHPIIERIQQAGGIIHIRTATPEFSCAGFTHSRLWGVTRNPWNTEFSPGGSSGGSAAALAAGLRTAGHRQRHRRFHPDPCVVLWRRRLQAAVRTSARTRRRTTSISTATTAHSLEQLPTARCSRT